MPLIGTAGHVDHGKSTLVQALTGRDPDRWEVEKRRGLTIDLGFAWATLPGGIEVSFVDVPGHQRYVKNLLAGIESIDVALLVVAADDGWMPQTEEHLAVLTLLGIDRAVIAVTRVDLVDAEQTELAVEEVKDRVTGTPLAAANVVTVSPVSGEGIDELTAELGRLAAEARPRDIGRPRMWVDRVFTAAGAGLVVTGTLLDGSLASGDEIVCHPSGQKARIRTIQTHERVVDEAGPGRRVALNLVGVSGLTRGHMIGMGGHWRMSSRFSCLVETARYVDELDERGAYHLHIGSMASPIVINARERDLMVVRTERSVPLAVGDRFIVRDTGRRLVVGGGRVVDPHPGRTARALIDGRRIDPGAAPDSIATTLLAVRGAAGAGSLEADSGGGSPLEGDLVDHTWLAPGVIDDLCTRVIDLVDESHRTHPLRDGLSLSSIAGSLGVSSEVAIRVVELSPLLERSGSVVARKGHRAASTDDAERVVSTLGADLAVPMVSELGADVELIHLMVRRGELVRISPELVMLPSQVEQLAEVIRGLDDGFTIADFRDRTGLSRKYAIPVLEWSDREGLTVRRGDGRSPI